MLRPWAEVACAFAVPTKTADPAPGPRPAPGPAPTGSLPPSYPGGDFNTGAVFLPAITAALVVARMSA
jgi:hypothetical protein